MPACTSDSNPTCPGGGFNPTNTSELISSTANVTPERRRLTKGRTSVTDAYSAQLPAAPSRSP